MQKTCSYCNAIYQPRAQVKNPKACNKSPCQRLRQRDNEREWHRKNRDLYDREYHKIQRTCRQKCILDTISNLIEFFTVGARFAGRSIGDTQILTQLFASIGIRKLNKLWIPISP